MSEIFVKALQKYAVPKPRLNDFTNDFVVYESNILQLIHNTEVEELRSAEIVKHYLVITSRAL